MKKDELENASQEQQKISIEEKTKVIKRLIDKNIDVFKRLAKKCLFIRLHPLSLIFIIPLSKKAVD
mgnify:CR=1 FL=1